MFWYTISHTSSAQNQMKLCTHLPYVIPQDCFLENSGNSKNLSQKTIFCQFGLRKNSLSLTHVLVHDFTYFQFSNSNETLYTPSLCHSAGLFFGKFCKVIKFIPKNLFFWQFGLIKIHSRSPKLWYTISHTSSSQNRMKLCTLLPYVLPQDYFLENSGISEKLSQKNTFFCQFGLRKNSLTLTKMLIHDSTYFQCSEANKTL